MVCYTDAVFSQLTYSYKSLSVLELIINMDIPFSDDILAVFQENLFFTIDGYSTGNDFTTVISRFDT